jgi:glycine C-acetyltransferase
MKTDYLKFMTAELHKMQDNGLLKEERTIRSPQSSKITLSDGREVLNFCSNNYLGLASDPRIIEAAKQGLDKWGYGLSSVRFICGTQEIHKELEKRLSDFLGTEDTILYSSCFDANGGLFETILGPEDAILSDEMNHASIIDGVRLCKARRYRYGFCNMEQLESALAEASDARFRLVVTDGVFSMDGKIAPLDMICDLAEKYDAIVMADDSHSTGFIGKHGRGTHEYRNCMDRVDILTGTFGKALGGASGGYVSGRKEIIALLRQRSRPYLFSNTLAPSIASACIAVINILSESTELRDRLMRNTMIFRSGLISRGFQIPEGEHPIVPLMLGDAYLATEMARQLMDEGIYVIGFSYPVVPVGKARIRFQVSASHDEEQINFALDAITRVHQKLSSEL